MTQGVMRWMGKDGEQQTKLRSLTPAGILPCGLVRNRPRDRDRPTDPVGDPCLVVFVKQLIFVHYAAATSMDSNNHQGS